MFGYCEHKIRAETTETGERPRLQSCSVHVPLSSLYSLVVCSMQECQQLWSWVEHSPRWKVKNTADLERLLMNPGPIDFKVSLFHSAKHWASV